MGSVKDLTVTEEPRGDKPGAGRFVFSDRYSVFDWGEMPDHIHNKGKALCLTGAYFFERIRDSGIKTHYLGLVEDGEAKSLSGLSAAPDTMEVKLVKVIEPCLKDSGYDYSIFKTKKANFLIPIEVIYRNTLPEGSSVFRRLKEGNLKPEDMGLSEMPHPGQELPMPLLDVSTKLEAIDRYLSWDEAESMCGLSDEELRHIRDIVLKVNELISIEAGRLGLVNNDGKMEFAFDENRNIMLVDVVGTLDECRFTFNDIPLSKEIARIFYRSTPWYNDVNEAKKKDPVNWKEHVTSAPPNLPEEYAVMISGVYQSFCNGITGRKWFEVEEIRNIEQKLKEIC
jgi:phosphoribosylaminoimidazole-succinocarboxamide synthase